MIQITKQEMTEIREALWPLACFAYLIPPSALPTRLIGAFRKPGTDEYHEITASDAIVASIVVSKIDRLIADSTHE